MISEEWDGNFCIESDGRTVWVHSMKGATVGRFGRNGVDIHNADGSGCLDCTHGAATVEDWERFVAGMGEHYGVAVSDRHRPAYLGESS